jgi:Zn-finger nucleic acid-binding protein
MLNYEIHVPRIGDCQMDKKELEKIVEEHRKTADKSRETQEEVKRRRQEIEGEARRQRSVAA